MFSWKAVIFTSLCKIVYMLSTSIADASLCEEGWKQYDQHCYKYQGNNSQWSTASANCNSMGGHLPSIHSKQQNDIFRDMYNLTGVIFWWTGLHDHEVDGIFAWDDGTDVDYTNWRSDEPIGDYIYSGNCAAMRIYITPITRSGQWYILPCTNTLGYMCQKKISANVSTRTETDDRTIDTILFISTEMDDSTVYRFPHTIVDTVAEEGLSSCEEGWKRYDEHCFKLEKEHLDRNNASEKCMSMGGHLGSIHSKEQSDFFGGFSKEAEKTYWWIGLYGVKRNIYDLKFVWDDGTDVDYTNWRPGEPDTNFHFSNAYCVAESFNIQYSGNWYLLACKRQLPYLCQKKLTTSILPNKEKTDSHDYIAPTTAVHIVPRKDLSLCENGWKLYEQHCFKLEESNLGWRAASAKCRRMGGYLSSIHSKEQNDIFEEITKETGQMIWWTGLHDLEVDGIFKWDDGTDVDYSNWRPAEPSGKYSVGNCVAQSFTHSNYYDTHGMWYILECDRRLYSMCQKKIAGSINANTELDVSTVKTSVDTRTELDVTTVKTSVDTRTELDVTTVKTSADTRTELDVTTVPRPVMTSTQIDDNTGLINRKMIKENEYKEGFISVTTYAVTLTIVIVFMALFGALLYCKRPWIEERRLKVATVVFKRTGQVAEPSTKLIIEPEETR